MTHHSAEGATLFRPTRAEFADRLQVWGDVKNVIYDQNAYGNMSEVLKALGITTKNQKDYNTQFGITLNKRSLQKIEPAGGHNLTAGINAEATTTSAQTVLEQLQADFDVQAGEVDMLIMDIPNIQPQDVPVVMQIAAAVQKEGSRPDSESLYGTMGVCTVSPTSARMAHGTDSPFSDGTTLFPQAGAGQIFPEARFNVDLQAEIEAARVQITQQPEHGTVVLKDGFDFKYLPNQNFVGNDKAVFLVNIGGHNVKVVYFIKVVDAELTSKNLGDLTKKYCPKTEWRISFSAEDAGAIASVLTQDWFNPNQSNITVTFGNLTGSAVGEATGEGANATITLDDNAAGHGWFVDATPGTNEEFLPTSSTNEWVAKAGSEAAGKMDMLTVLLHWATTSSAAHSKESPPARFRAIANPPPLTAMPNT